jgi:zinc/manganese transport system permease protein
MLDPSLASLSDSRFRVPLLAGLLLAALLPVIGALLMLRDEWLAALGLSHLAAASALLGSTLGLPTLIGGTAGALAGGALKTRFEARGNLAYAVMILIGWPATLLIGANTELGEQLAHALVEGQLYFAGVSEFVAVLVLVASAIWTLPRILPQLLRSRFFPRFEQANDLPSWRWHLAMDLLTAASLATGTLTVGLMGVFALVLIPAWGSVSNRTELALDAHRVRVGRSRRLPDCLRSSLTAGSTLRPRAGRSVVRHLGRHAAAQRIMGFSDRFVARTRQSRLQGRALAHGMTALACLNSRRTATRIFRSLPISPQWENNVLIDMFNLLEEHVVRRSTIVAAKMRRSFEGFSRTQIDETGHGVEVPRRCSDLESALEDVVVEPGVTEFGGVQGVDRLTVQSHLVRRKIGLSKCSTQGRIRSRCEQ